MMKCLDKDLDQDSSLTGLVKCQKMLELTTYKLFMTT